MQWHGGKMLPDPGPRFCESLDYLTLDYLTRSLSFHREGHCETDDNGSY